MADDFLKDQVYTPPMNSLKTKGTAKLLNLFFIIDTSGSMRSEGRLDAVNDAFKKMVPALKKIQEESMSEFELKIAVMTFDEEAKWVVEPTPILEYNHVSFACSEWVTYFSNAFKTFGDKLSRKHYMAHTGKIAQPYIMLMTDGEPTADDDYNQELDALLENGWFKASQRFAVLIGRDTINSKAAREAVSRFVSNPVEGIIDAADAEAIVSEVQAKTIHTIQIATKHGVPTADVQDDTTQEADLYGGTNEPAGFEDDFAGFGGFDGFDGFDDGSFI